MSPAGGAGAETRSVVGRPRLDSLTGLRWWAAFGVFIYHMLNFAPIPILSLFAPFGNSGVAFFFVLSGFVLSYSAKATTTTRNFYWRRFARIYPAHFVALLLAIPVFYSVTPDPQQDWVKPFSIGILLLSVFLLQGWSRDPVILFSGNPAAWTLTVEAFFYLLHPLLNRGLQLLRSRGATILILIAFATAIGYRVLVVLQPESFWAMLPLPITRINEFVIGMGLARLMLLGVRLPVAPIGAYLLITGFILWQVLGARYTLEAGFFVWSHYLREEILLGLFAVIILAVATRDATGGRSLLRTPVLLHLGAWSFAFYLLHATVMYVFLAVFGKQAPSFTNLVWYVPVFGISLLLSWMLYRFVERPLEMRMRRWGDRSLR